MSIGVYPPLDGTQPCRTEPQELFFPVGTERGTNNRAKAICHRCPFEAACLNYALGHQLYGIWGGTTQDERRKIQRKRGITPKTVSGSREAAR